MAIRIIYTGILVFVFFGTFAQIGMHIDTARPTYWKVDGQTTLLLGGSDNDNLFQSQDLTGKLSLLKEAGGNYVRCVMSARDSGDEQAFLRLPSGLYDLNFYNKTYWDKFKLFLEYCSIRRIVVQIEVWATFDFYREPWSLNPYNPKNNVNYGSAQTGVPEYVPSHPTSTENAFFFSVPALKDQQKILYFQQRFVDKLLSFTLKYDNILYCIDNETSLSPQWGAYWADYIHKKAKEADKTAYITEMWDKWELSDAQHANTIEHPETYDYVDISQNNHLGGKRHWNNALATLKRIDSIKPRPANNVKIYGADGNKFKDSDHVGIARFIQSVLIGSASARFHRPPAGLGQNQKALQIIKLTRRLSQLPGFFDGKALPLQNDIIKTDKNEASIFIRTLGKGDALIYCPEPTTIKLRSGAGKPKKTRFFGPNYSEEGQDGPKIYGRNPRIPIKHRHTIVYLHY